MSEKSKSLASILRNGEVVSDRQLSKLAASGADVSMMIGALQLAGTINSLAGNVAHLPNGPERDHQISLIRLGDGRLKKYLKSERIGHLKDVAAGIK